MRTLPTGFQCGEAGEVLSDVNVVIDDEASHELWSILMVNNH